MTRFEREHDKDQRIASLERALARFTEHIELLEKENTQLKNLLTARGIVIR